MATTTNYGWTTPDDTDLVKDGAAAIRTLGSSIDTTTKNLNPETTTGDIAYRSATANVNTRLPLGTAGQVLKVNSGATAPEWATDASGMTNPMTTTGDTIYSSSGSTPARLGIGSTGDVLTVAGGVPSWAAPAGGGGLTLLDTLSLSGSSTTSATFSSAYKYLILYVTQVYGSTTNSLGMRLNADSGNNYAYQLFTDGGVDTATATNRIRIATMSTNSATLERTYAIVQLWRPSDTDVVYVNSTQTCRSSTNPEYQTSVGVYDNSAAITSVTILPGAGTMTAGTVYIYGGN
jgi:hypothetical protein